MTQQGVTSWLKFASAVVIGFGALGFANAVFGITAIAQLFADLAFWPVDGQPANAPTRTEGLLWAIVNGISIGWGILLWQVSTHVYPVQPVVGRRMILGSIGAWFIVDGAGSALAGAPFNIVLNLTFLLLFAIPLWRAVRD